MQAKAAGICVRDIKFHKSEIISATKTENDILAGQKLEKESEVRGRLRNRKDSVSSPSKLGKKGKLGAGDKKKIDEEKKESSDEIEEEEEDEEGPGKNRKIAQKGNEVLAPEVLYKNSDWNKLLIVCVYD